MGAWVLPIFPIINSTPTKSSAPQFGRALPYCSPTTEALPRRSKITNNLSLPRFLLQKRTCSCTPRCTCASPSRTSAASAASHSPTAPTCRSTCGSTLGSSRTVARSANESSPSSHTFSSTSGHTQGTSLTSAEYQVSPNLTSFFDPTFFEALSLFWVCQKSKNQGEAIFSKRSLACKISAAGEHSLRQLK